jgi:hypothetical protein
MHPHAPRRVFETAPDIRLIALLRDPVDRAYSFYQMKVRHGFETLSFEEAVEREAARLDGELKKMLADENYDSFNLRNYSYLYRGIYIEHLNSWLKHFSRDQLLIIHSDELYADPVGIVDRVSTFLDIPEHPEPRPASYRKLNFAPYPELDTRTRRDLTEYFRPFNQRLYDLLGADLGWESRAQVVRERG